MKENLFTIPETISAGYQNRSGTVNGRLAYVIYTDDKGVLRKEKSWNSWRDKDIPTTVNNNEPHRGFFLNKHVGGYVDHWLRQSYIRVYDKTFDLEFEITLSNLNYILSTCSWNPDEGLDGDFVYAWYGTDLWLLPTKSEAYKASIELTERTKASKKFKEKDLIIGHGYRFKDDSVHIYLGKLTEFRTNADCVYIPTGMYDVHYFMDNSTGYMYHHPIKDIIEDWGVFTITSIKLLNRLSGKEFNYTGIAYFHPTPTLLKDFLSANAHLYVCGCPATIECAKFDNGDVYNATYINNNRYKCSTGKCSIRKLANIVQVAGVFKDGKLSHILT